MLKGLLGGMDNQISSFTKILQRKRSPIQIGPDGSAQGLLYKLGLTGIGNTQSPEATVAMIMKEYVSLRGYPVDTQISVIEFRVFGTNCSAADPSFSELEDWISWRLPRAFSNHKFHACDGWTPEFYKFARERALEHFV